MNWFLNKKDNKKYCQICKNSSIFREFGNPARKDVLCPKCGSLERHRFLYYIYNFLFLGDNRKLRLLHMAPEKCLFDLFGGYKNIEYTAADLQPERYGFVKCLEEDFVSMSFPDKYFDVILSNQIIEHIQDEQTYLLEIKRCLKDDGCVILNLPFKSSLLETYEDNTVKTDEQKMLAYGNPDHVRLYGSDVQLRLEKAGFVVNKIDVGIFSKEIIELNGLNAENDYGDMVGGYFVMRKKIV